MALRLVQIAMNARDDSAVGRFWAEALGWGADSEEPGVTNLEPGGSRVSRPGRRLHPHVIAVPESKTVKNRVHIDLATTSAAHQADLGLACAGSRRDAGRRGPGRSTMDRSCRPGGQRVCGAPAPLGLPGHTGPIAAVVCDCADPRAIAGSRAQAMDWSLHRVTDELAALRSAKGVGPDLLVLVGTPYVKTVEEPCPSRPPAVPR